MVLASSFSSVYGSGFNLLKLIWIGFGVVLELLHLVLRFTEIPDLDDAEICNIELLNCYSTLQNNF